MGMVPCRGVDDDGDGSTSWPYLALAPHACVVSQSWCPVPSWRVVWATGTLDRNSTGVRWHSVGLPDAVGIVSPLAWPIAATGHVEACPLPSRCQKFDPQARAFTSIAVGDSAGPCEACVFARDRIRALRVERDGARALGVGRDGVCARGVRRGGPPQEVGRDGNYALNRLGELMFIAISFLPSGIPNIDTRQ
jgi:hypothetical protein